MKARILNQLDAVDKRIAALEKLPKREAGERYENAEHTYRQVWENATTEERRQLLLRSGITLTIYRYPGTNAVVSAIYTPHEIRERLAK